MSINRRSFLGAVTGFAAAAGSLLGIRQASAALSSSLRLGDNPEPQLDGYSAYVQMRYRCYVRLLFDGDEYERYERADFNGVVRRGEMFGMHGDRIAFVYKSPRKCTIFGLCVADLHEKGPAHEFPLDYTQIANPGDDKIFAVPLPRS